MRNLKLVGLSEDGRQVMLVDDAGTEFATPADDRLRAALRGDRARLGQLEIEMDSALRPRDIQARIRAGDSPEDVATLAQVSADKIMPYCVPVLAERQHVAELAQRSHVRRTGAEGPARKLSEVVAERLRGRGVSVDSAEWDAWQRDDGRWTVQVTYQSGERERNAVFVFDAMGRYSTSDDDEAKWLTGERQATSKGPQPRETGKGGERRLSAVPAEGDLLSLGASGEVTDDLTAVIRAVDETEEEEPAAEETDAAHNAAQEEVGPATATQPDDADDGADDGADEAAAEGADEAAAEGPAEEGTPRTAPVEVEEADADTNTDTGSSASKHSTRRRSAKAKARKGDDTAQPPATEPTPERKRKSKRASVPSWDEIMFGKDDGDDDSES